MLFRSSNNAPPIATLNPCGSMNVKKFPIACDGPSMKLGTRNEKSSPAGIACGCCPGERTGAPSGRSEEHTSELQALMRSSYAVFCLKKKNEIIDSEIKTKH